MSVLPILTAPDERLRQVSKPVESVDANLRALMDDMLETMYAAPGIGLAAPQVGVLKRVVVMDLGEDERAPRFFVNPEIVWQSDTLSVFEEGCLSVPDVFEEVKRPDRCKAVWLDYQGRRQAEDCSDLLATCLQHEIDHLNGVLFVDHISRLKRDRALNRLKKRERMRSTAIL